MKIARSIRWSTEPKSVDDGSSRPLFPLTPALSRGEREGRWPRFEEGAFRGAGHRRQAEACTMNRRGTLAFTLLEVIIACALFFMFAFAVLELVTRGLSAARSIQQREPDVGLVFAPLSTNKTFEVGSYSGDFEENYPGVYPGYQWSCDISQPFGETNPLYQVTVTIIGKTGKRRTSETSATALMWGSQMPLGFGSKFGGGQLGGPR